MHITVAQEHFICGTGKKILLTTCLPSKFTNTLIHMPPGGKILESLKRLMTNLTHLENIELIDLLLDSSDEAIHLLDDVCNTLCEKLDRLVLINLTKIQFHFLHPACFVNLRVLKISPQNLGEEVLELLADNKRMKELHIIMNNYTEPVPPIERKVWAKVKFRVYLRYLHNKERTMELLTF